MPIELAARYGAWALIAGASEGLGAALGAEAAARGLNVVAVARRGGLLEEQAERWRGRSRAKVRTVVADFAAPDFWPALAAATDDLEIGVLVWNATFPARGRFFDVTLGDHLTGIDVNCRAPTILCHELGRRMLARRRGAIALITSLGALQGLRLFASYGASKAYDWILAEGLWDELREQGIDVVSYVVGATATPAFSDHADREAAQAALSSEDLADPETALAFRLQHPMAPEAVARGLFEALAAGPRAFSDPLDRQTAESLARLPRERAVRAMGDVVSRVFHALETKRGDGGS